MKKIINQLVQLQELLEARAQQETLTQAPRLAQLDESIAAMQRGLDPDIAARFARVQKKNPLAIVPVTGGVCTGCGMSLPVSQVHAVHAAKELHQCPNCARFLYYQDADAPRRLGTRKRHTEPLKAGIARFSALNLMIPQLTAPDRDGAVVEICAKLQDEGFVDQGARLAEQTLRREAMASTAMDNGLAFPHARGIEGGGLTLALALSPKGIRFSPDIRALTRIVFFVAIPTAASAFYLKLLAGLTKSFGEEGNREKMLLAQTPEQMWKVLTQVTRRTIP